ncbi:hypothetical protein HBI07_114560 [Parastagonospora nodorum]|nr:hypothetical protein HBI07_114560 [Parastagonospora nodorum]
MSSHLVSPRLTSHLGSLFITLHHGCHHQGRMDDICSSDVEYDEPVNRFANAGKVSIVKMLEHAFEDRMASKKQVKTLGFSKGTPATQYNHTLWWNRVSQFMQATLNKGPNHVPTGLDLERFFSSIVSRVKPNNPIGVPSYTWMKSGIRLTVEVCKFHHKTFILDGHDIVRLGSLVDKLCQEGKLTREPAFEREWAGAVVVRKLVNGLIADARVNGTLAWDVTLLKCLSITLLAALGARSGDLTRNRLDEHDLPYLAYQDVILRLVLGGSTIDDMEAVVTIRNEKGNKLNPALRRMVLLRALKSPEDACICPIKLLVTLALRLGNVEERSIDELIDHTRRRGTRTVIWKHPRRPVIPKLSKRGRCVLPDDPADVNQATKAVLPLACRVSGFFERLRSHDLRRGAARDAANISAKVHGISGSLAGAVLGHSKKGKQMTAHYVGNMAVDIWSLRTDENWVDPFDRKEVAEMPYQAPFKYKPTSLITDICRVEGLDETKVSDRLKAGVLAEKRRQGMWVQQEREKRLRLSPDLALIQGSPGLETAQTDLHRDDGEIDQQEDVEAQAQAMDIGNFICGNGDGGPSSHQIDELMLDTLQGHDGLQETGATRSALDFVRHFSTVNITANQTFSLEGNKWKDIARIQGNSRDPPTSFLYACKNHVYGCPFNHRHRATLAEQHELTCPYINHEIGVELAAQKAVDRLVKCTTSGCDKTFVDEKKLKSHVSNVHGWPRMCAKAECKAGPFPDITSLNKHRKTHDNFKFTKCVVDGCTSDYVFEDRNRYRRHIRYVHKIIDRKAIDEIVGTNVHKWQERKCGIDGCSSRATFRRPGEFSTHLQTDKHHDFTEEEIAEIVG